MNYEETLNFLNISRYSGSRPGLEPMIKLMHILGDPQDDVNMHYVHIAGTNGKGSVADYLNEIFIKAGYRTGLYTSPYLNRFNERIRINDEMISDDDLARIATEVQKAADQLNLETGTYPTVFELVTACAFLYFKEQNCDIVILEVGLGGRLDATNIIKKPEISVITHLDLDHQDLLGETLGEIAHEKAGIIKPGCPVVTYPQMPDAEAQISEAAEQNHSELIKADFSNLEIIKSDLDGAVFRNYYDESVSTDFSDTIGRNVFYNKGTENGRAFSEYLISMPGKYQIKNAEVSLVAAKYLSRHGWKLSEYDIHEGLKAARWKGRFEIVSRDPFIIIDGAHNPDGVRAMVESLKTLFHHGEKITFVAGFLKDKDYKGMTAMAEQLAERFLCVTPESSRALNAYDLAEKIRSDGYRADAYDMVEEAMDDIYTKYSDNPVCVFGSLYYIGAARQYCIDRNKN